MKQYVLIFLLFSGIQINYCKAQANNIQQIKNVLAQQTGAWNAGSVENFMKGYWPNDSLLFVGKSGVTYGWNHTLENYKRNYPDTAAMGKLDFNILQVKKLSESYYFVVGKWHLSRSIGDLAGHFTLLFRKIRNQWLIVVDHSS